MGKWSCTSQPVTAAIWDLISTSRSLTRKGHTLLLDLIICTVQRESYSTKDVSEIKKIVFFVHFTLEMTLLKILFNTAKQAISMISSFL